MAQRLGALERQILALSTEPTRRPPDRRPRSAPSSVAADLERLRADLTLSLDVLAQLAESVDASSTAGAAPEDDDGDDLRQQLMLHTDLALAGALRVIDDRLARCATRWPMPAAARPRSPGSRPAR